KLTTRNGHDWTPRFPAIAAALGALPVETAILDGEAVVEDEAGVSNFSALQDALSEGRAADGAALYAFDLLYLDGSDLRGLPLEERKGALAALVRPEQGAGVLRLSEHIEADGEAVVRHACRLGLEGVVSKRRDRPYRSGRVEDWLKIKCTNRQEFVIAGFTPSSALKNAIGSLILGVYENGRLIHVGRTGTGFTSDSARDLWKRLKPLRVDASPFETPLNTLQKRDAVWVRPELVAEVEFRGWTADRHLRHAAFKGLREDKRAQEVVIEAPKKAPAKGGRPGKEETRVTASGEVEVAGVPLTHPDRILWEEQGVTKQGLAEYYEEVARWVLPHVVRRPLALVRCPSGSQKGCFFQKHSWAGVSDFIRRATVRDEDGEDEVLLVEEIRGVIALVQAGVLEIHPWGATIEDVERPDRIVMDLDPGEGVAWPRVIEGARELRERLKALGLESFVKTTGGKGLHVVVPLAPAADWDTVKAFAKDLADAMERDNPQAYVAMAAKKARAGRIYVDYLRNGRGATAIAAYSTRARPGAPVSTPLAWDELSPALKPNHFTVSNLPSRLERLRDDPWAALFAIRQTLPAAKSAPAKRKTARAKRA
ncbi:MAG TPA: DNA ligase D, partial [Pyrinomonadaceae bacterium]